MIGHQGDSLSSEISVIASICIGQLIFTLGYECPFILGDQRLQFRHVSSFRQAEQVAPFSLKAM
jgi:hypothetical protein